MSSSDITIVAIMGLSGGNTARKRLARRKLNLVDADINAYSCLMNSPERLMFTKERLQIVAALAELQSSKVT